MFISLFCIPGFVVVLYYVDKPVFIPWGGGNRIAAAFQCRDEI